METKPRQRQFSIPPAYAKGFQGLSSYLGGVSENTLRSWVKRGMPYTRIGDVILFRLSAVDAWVGDFKAVGTFTQEEVNLDNILVEVDK